MYLLPNHVVLRGPFAVDSWLWWSVVLHGHVMFFYLSVFLVSLIFEATCVVSEFLSILNKLLCLYVLCSVIHYVVKIYVPCHHTTANNCTTLERSCITCIFPTLPSLSYSLLYIVCM